LFSHLSAAGNLRFAERRARADGVRLDRTAIIEALDLEPLLERKPATLSGGERQRVALARALLTAPRLMLLDEPLTALDRARRARTTRYLTDALHRFGVPSLHITHDVDEALAVADRVLVLREGQVQGFGEPEAMISRALELGEAGDLSVIVRGVVVRRDTALKLTEVAVEGQPLYVPLNAALTPGMRTALRLRARDVMIAVQPPHSLSVQNVLSGVITSIEPDVSEAFVTVTLTTPLGPVYAHITHAAREVLDLEPGGQVFALIKSLHVLA
jgi:molybdate transport system ATP-binding protein